jgi:hypothetical protein
MNTKKKKGSSKRDQSTFKNPEHYNDDLKYDLESGDNPDEREQIYKQKK